MVVPEHDQGALKRPHEGPQRPQQGLRKLGFPQGKRRFPQTMPKISYRVKKTCKKERAETMLKKRPKNLAQKPLLKALKRLNLTTCLLDFDDFRKTS
jgi:hypothetical protein